ncbi:MAG: hypothetical protein ACFFCW_40975 [Candidatus Hodarchaeota archaeon]
MVYDVSAHEYKEKFWASLEDEQKRSLLSLQSAQVSLSKNDTSGKISYLTSYLSGAQGSYTVIMDYMKYRVEDVIDQGTKEITTKGYAKGVKTGEDNLRMMNEILNSVAPSKILNKSAWDNFVEKSDLDNPLKNELKQLDNFSKVELRLKTDAGSTGLIISKLHAQLQNNQ